MSNRPYVALLCFIGSLAAVLMIPAWLTATAGLQCAPQTVQVNNQSSHKVDIIEFQWLNSRGNGWLSEDISPAPIARGNSWQTQILLTDLLNPETYLKARYRVLGSQISDLQFTSQRHVPSCLNAGTIMILIVDKRR
ncbi:MAG: hypothetical protein ABJP66_01745 [Hyphomicrobiales bacterium]